jgi:hypothetical protein
LRKVKLDSNRKAFEASHPLQWEVSDFDFWTIVREWFENKTNLSKWFLHHWDSSTTGYLKKADYVINCSRIKSHSYYIYFVIKYLESNRHQTPISWVQLTWTVNLSELSLVFLESSGNNVSYYKSSPRIALWGSYAATASHPSRGTWCVRDGISFWIETSQHDNISVTEGHAILNLGYLLPHQKEDAYW